MNAKTKVTPSGELELFQNHLDEIPGKHDNR